ncbi:hypothetical protein BAUCODRAFT_34390 [Baudoinia panamericana UAMH 10762]|uniref:Phosphatidylinositol-specific phospholipase C X domain-containing protein n=1 Tax=Baudoinia panamericana (strain UAMH 10762) TaxID=717646 RepID=M2MVP2_BAUPA|nr:uncharacterized protein BAUCODRAFT_34390 [Baudoinia panamericana UAMH 10762]EMC95633.1 hypothetical protein BAUCODRAFT_34390 [Baudoinia panamericana UAMH 10762]
MLLLVPLVVAVTLGQWTARGFASARAPRSAINVCDRVQDHDPHPNLPGRRTPPPESYTKRYSEQTFIGTHNSAAIRTAENGWSLSGNQYFNVSVQLESGVRLLQAQAHRGLDDEDEIRLCHFNCALMDGGSLLEHLLIVREFLSIYPQDVVTLLFVNVVGGSLEPWRQVYEQTGLSRISYSPPSAKRAGNMTIWDWPTIEELVNNKKRLITFLSSGADESAVPYLLNQFDYMFETDFGIEAPNQYTCEPARPKRYDLSHVPPRLSLVNHFLYAKFFGIRYPNASYASFTNAAGFHTGELGEHAARCRSTYERRPNFLLVDFFNEGSVFDVEYGMNAY